MPRSLSARTAPLNLTPAERAKIANKLRNYVPAGGINPEREEDKFLELIWEMMVTMDAEKKLLDEFERAILNSSESSMSSGDSMETEEGEEAVEQGEGGEDGDGNGGGVSAETWDDTNDGWGVWGEITVETEVKEEVEEEGKEVEAGGRKEDEEGEEDVGFVSGSAFRVAAAVAARASTTTASASTASASASTTTTTARPALPLLPPPAPRHPAKLRTRIESVLGIPVFVPGVRRHNKERKTDELGMGVGRMMRPPEYK